MTKYGTIYYKLKFEPDNRRYFYMIDTWYTIVKHNIIATLGKHLRHLGRAPWAPWAGYHAIPDLGMACHAMPLPCHASHHSIIYIYLLYIV